MYKPEKIAQQNFSLKNTTLGAVYNAERDIQRLDARIRYSRYATAVRRTLTRGDGLGILNNKLIFPDLYSVMRVEAAGFLLSPDKDTNHDLAALLSNESHPTLDKAIEAYRFIEAIDLVTGINNSELFASPENILKLYDSCDDSIRSTRKGTTFRQTPYFPPNDNTVESTYIPARPEEIESLVADYCDFINADVLSPLIQASISQFQFEAVRPFDQNLDRMERLSVHYIFANRKMLESIIFPVSFFPPQSKEEFFALLLPSLEVATIRDVSMSDLIDRLILYTVEVAQDLLLFVVSLHNALSGLVDKWKTKLERVDRGSATELLLLELAGRPVLTIKQACELIGKSFSTTSEAFERLENAGIVYTGRPIRRSKTFEAPEAIFFHDNIYRKYLPPGSIKRDIRSPLQMPELHQYFPDM